MITEPVYFFLASSPSLLALMILQEPSNLHGEDRAE